MAQHRRPPAVALSFEFFPPKTAAAAERLWQTVEQLNEAGILQGYVDRRYQPDGRGTRAQMASILDRTYKFLTGEALPSDGDQFSDDSQSVHQESINAVAAADIMHGIDGRFEPNLHVKRGPMAQYAARTMIRLEETGRIRPPQ